MKKLIAFILCLAMVLSIIPAAVFADDNTEQTEVVAMTTETEFSDVSDDPAESEEPGTSAEEMPATRSQKSETRTITPMTEEEAAAVAVQTWDVSAAQDGSITMYLVPNGDDTYTLYAFGSGAIKDYTSSVLPPWREYEAEITGSFIDAGITQIGNYAFASISGLTNVIIPDTVTEIGENAFMFCPNIQEINIPDSVTTIQKFCFAGCSSITDMTIPESVTNLGQRIFVQCKQLENVTLLANINEIPGYTFAGCTGVKTIYISKYFNNLTASMFSSCTSLEKIEVDEDNEYYNSFSGILYNEENTEMVYIPSNLTSSEMIIPEGIAQIPANMFLNNENITSITIPSTLTNVGTNAFKGCSNLGSVYISSMESWLNIDFASIQSSPFVPMYSTSGKTVSANLYLNGSLVTGIEIPNTITEIKDYSFTALKQLTSVTIPNSVTSIGNRAFVESGLQSVSIPSSVTIIDEQAFGACTDLETVELHEGLEEIGRSAFQKTAFPEIYIPSTLQKIGSRAFANSQVSGVITIPENCDVGSGIFVGCANLEKVVWKQESYTTSNAFVHENLTYIFPDNSLAWCEPCAQGMAINTLLHEDHDAYYYVDDVADAHDGDDRYIHYQAAYIPLYEKYGITYEQIRTSETNLRETIPQALSDGKLVVIGSKLSSNETHAYVLFGISEDGYFYEADGAYSPASMTELDPEIVYRNIPKNDVIMILSKDYDTSIKSDELQMQNNITIPEFSETLTMTNDANDKTGAANSNGSTFIYKDSAWTDYNVGKAETEIKFAYTPEAVDYIYVLDCSESMNKLTLDEEYTNLSLEKTAAYASIESLLSSGIDARVSVVSFQGKEEALYTEFTSDAEDVYDAIANATCQGFTCYADGFNAALDAMESRTGADANRKTVVIFATDGEQRWWVNSNDMSTLQQGELTVTPVSGSTNFGAAEADALREAGAEIRAIILNSDPLESTEAKMEEIAEIEDNVYFASTAEELAQAFESAITSDCIKSFTITDTIGEDFNYNGNLTAADGTTAVIDEANRTITWTLENILPNTEYTLSFGIQSKKDSSGQFVCGDLPTNLGNAVVKEGDIVVNEVETPVLHRDPVLVDDGAQAHMIHKYTDLKRADNPALYTDGIRFVMDLNMKELQDTYEPGDKLAFGIAMLPLDKLQNGQTTNYLTMNVGTAGQLTCNGSYTFVNNTSAINSSKKLAPANMITWTEAMENCTTPAAFAKLLKAAGMSIFDVTDTGIQYSVYMMFSNANTRQAQADREIAYRGIMVSYDAQNGYAVKYSFQRNNSATRIYNHYNCINYNVINVKGATAADMLHGESEYNPAYELQIAAVIE